MYFFNTAPDCSGELSDPPDRLVLLEDAAMTAADYSPACDDVDSQAMTFSMFRSALPNGISISSAGVVTGTPDTENEAGVAIRIAGTDIGGLADTIDNRFIYVVNTWAMSTITGDTVTAANATIIAAAPWLTETLSILVTFNCDATVAKDDIISQNPAASAEIGALDAISAVVSTGQTCSSRRRRL